MRKDSKILQGNKNNPPLIFLHGFMGNKSDWLDVSDRFGNEFFCILPDLIGHGENTFFPKNISINYKNYSDQILSLLDLLDIEKATLVGYSMGGRIALHTAINYPDRIKNLVLESTNPGIETENDRHTRLKLDKSRAEKIEINGLDQFVTNWYENPLFESLKNNQDLYSKMLSYRSKNDPQWMSKIIFELSPGRQDSLWQSLGNLNLPTLLISGELDSKYQKIMGDCKNNIMAAVHQSVPNAGHNSHAEQPAIFADYLYKFLKIHTE